MYYFLYDSLGGNRITYNQTGRFVGLTPGQTYTVYAGMAYAFMDTVRVTVPAYVRSTAFATFGVLCPGVTRGDIAISIRNGVAPFTFEIFGTSYIVRDTSASTVDRPGSGDPDRSVRVSR